MTSSPRILVYGGKGALGQCIVKYFKSKKWWVLSVDLFSNDEADANLIIAPTESWVEQGQQVEVKIESMLQEEKLNAVVCVAGGWAGGNAASQDLVKNSDLMWKQSVWTSVLASQISARHLARGGLLMLTGAKAALQGTPGMIGYGMAKAAVHQLVQSLSLPSSGLPENAKVLGILPVTLDTPANRKAMPDADLSSWTPLEFVAETSWQWANGQDCPNTGSLLSLVTSEGKTSITREN